MITIAAAAVPTKISEKLLSFTSGPLQTRHDICQRIENLWTYHQKNHLLFSLSDYAQFTTALGFLTKKVAVYERPYLPRKDSRFTQLQARVEMQLQDPSLPLKPKQSFVWLKELQEGMQACGASPSLFQAIDRVVHLAFTLQTDKLAHATLKQRRHTLDRFVLSAQDLQDSGIDLSTLSTSLQTILSEEELILPYFKIWHILTIIPFFQSIQTPCLSVLSLTKRAFIKEATGTFSKQNIPFSDLVDLAFLCSEIEEPMGREIVMAIKKTFEREQKPIFLLLPSSERIKLLAAFGQAGIKDSFDSHNSEILHFPKGETTLTSKSLGHIATCLTELPLPQQTYDFLLQTLISFINEPDIAFDFLTPRMQHALLQLFQNDSTPLGDKVFQQSKEAIKRAKLSSFPLMIHARLCLAFTTREKMHEDPTFSVFAAYLYRTVMARETKTPLRSWDDEALLLFFSAFSKTPPMIQELCRPFFAAVAEEFAKSGAFWRLSALQLTTFAEGYHRLGWFPDPVFSAPPRVTVYFCKVFASEGTLLDKDFALRIYSRLLTQLREAKAIATLKTHELLLLASSFSSVSTSITREIQPLFEMIASELLQKNALSSLSSPELILLVESFAKVECFPLHFFTSLQAALHLPMISKQALTKITSISVQGRVFSDVFIEKVIKEMRIHRDLPFWPIDCLAEFLLTLGLAGGDHGSPSIGLLQMLRNEIAERLPSSAWTNHDLVKIIYGFALCSQQPRAKFLENSPLLSHLCQNLISKMNPSAKQNLSPDEVFHLLVSSIWFQYPLDPLTTFRQYSPSSFQGVGKHLLSPALEADLARFLPGFTPQAVLKSGICVPFKKGSTVIRVIFPEEHPSESALYENILKKLKLSLISIPLAAFQGSDEEKQIYIKAVLKNL